MQNTMVGLMPAPPDNQADMYRAVVSDLASLIEHIRTSLKLIEEAVASEAAAEEMAADNVIVLDDVTPGYARVDAVLRECNAGLSVALYLLRGSVEPDAVELGGRIDSSPVRWPISA
jgi:hypothetical protein